LADTASRRRFLREVQTASSFNHPHILTVHDIGDLDGRQYLVTEFVDGGTLRDWAKSEARTWEQVVDLLVGVADGLATAHEAGIIHRDIKPQNILVSRSGYAKLADFGLAKAAASSDVTKTVEGSDMVTRWGTVMGTAGYMSPEQAVGAIVDARSDIFSFGVVLHEVLAGQRPFAASSTAEELRRLLHSAPNPLGDTVPQSLRRIVEKALERLPDQRYQSMREMLADLRLVSKAGAAELSVTAMPPGDRRRRLVISGAAVLAIALVAGVWQWRLSTASVNTVHALAILPLKPLQQNPEDDHLGLGIADTIITRIGQIEGMAVRPTSSVRRYGSAESDALGAARDLGVDAVLDGTFQRAGDRLRINLNLVRVSDGASLWSRSFSTTFNDIFAVEDEIAQQVVAELRLRLTPAEQVRLTKRYTSSPEAYEYYLKGIRTFGTVSGAGGNWVTGEVQTGLKMLERAVEIDPAYALAHAQMAWGYAWLGLFTPDAGPIWIERAREALARANAIDPDLAEAHVVRSLLLWSSFEGYQIVPAFEALKAAQRLNPNVGYFEMAGLYAHVGLIEPALLAFQRAIEIDPTTSAANQAEMVNALWFNARYQDAIDAAEKLSPRPRGWLIAYVGGGDVAGARRNLTAALAMTPNDNFLLALQRVLLAREGRFREAEEGLGLPPEAEQRNRNCHHGTYFRACIYGFGGKAEMAVEAMRDTVRHGMPNYPAFSRDACFDPIRQTAVFKEFMSELKPTWDGYERALR
jgi:serine/threonine-protein kinase